MPYKVAILFTTFQEDVDDEDREERLDRIRDKLKARKRKVAFEEGEEGADDDLEKFVDEQRQSERKAEL